MAKRLLFFVKIRKFLLKGSNMDINDLVKMVSALQSDKSNVENFQNEPQNFVQKFLGSNLSGDTLNAIIAGIGANFLGQKQNAVDNSSGIDFNSLIGKIAVSKLDTNGDGKLDLGDLAGLANNFFGGNKNQTSSGGGIDLGMIGNILKGLK